MNHGILVYSSIASPQVSMSQAIFVIALRSVLPPIFFLLSGFVFTLALYARGKALRSALFALIVILAIQSIEHARHNFGVFKPFVGHWTQVISNQVLHAAAILFIENHQIQHQDIRRDAIIWQGRRLIGYKLWNNVRRLPAPGAPQNDFQPESSGTISRYFLFYASGAAKVALIYLVNIHILPLLIRGSLVELQAQDLSPQKQVLLRRIHDVTAREVVIRLYFGAVWAWQSYSSFETLHIMVSWCFVSIGYDSPEEWPPLFGNVSEATSLRRFWANFWHQMIVPTYRSYGDAFAGYLGLKPDSQASKTVIAVAVFGISGLAVTRAAWSEVHKLYFTGVKVLNRLLGVSLVYQGVFTALNGYLRGYD